MTEAGRGDGGIGVHVDADFFHRLVHQLAQVRIEHAHRLSRAIDDGHCHMAMSQRLGHLHTDVSAAYHHGTPRPKPFQSHQERGPVVKSWVYPGGSTAAERRES